MMLVTLRGTPCLYYGDELALESSDVPAERVLDVATPSRDPGRTPMPWTPEGGWRDPWLPLGDTSRNVHSQRADPGSTLAFTRDLIALRRRLEDLRSGTYAELRSSPDTWAWRRGEGTVVALNLGDEAAEVHHVDGVIALSTNREREGEAVAGTLALSRREGAVLAVV
jgi:alpha-glucosidase